MKIEFNLIIYTTMSISNQSMEFNLKNGTTISIKNDELINIKAYLPDIFKKDLYVICEKLNIKYYKFCYVTTLKLSIEQYFIESEKNTINETYLWMKLCKSDTSKYINIIKFLLLEFGTKEPCNRFDVGNTIEFIISDMIQTLGYDVEELPNAKRIDLCINKTYKLSLKYSSIGNITLHNSNSCINKDLNMTDFLLLTPKFIYLITKKELLKNKIILKNYLINSGDSLKLKRTILKELHNKKYQFIVEFDITINKNNCKNRLCSKLFYKSFISEYNSIK